MVVEKPVIKVPGFVTESFMEKKCRKVLPYEDYAKLQEIRVAARRGPKGRRGKKDFI